MLFVAVAVAAVLSPAPSTVASRRAFLGQTAAAALVSLTPMSAFAARSDLLVELTMLVEVRHACRMP